MALIYRAIFEVDDPDGGFVDRAAAHFQEWIRIKLSERALSVPTVGRIDRPEKGIQVSAATADDAGLRIFRGALFEAERFHATDIETQLIAISSDATAIVWVDIDRIASSATADTEWVPTAPNIVKRLLNEEEAYCGPTLLTSEPIQCDARATKELVGLILDPRRETSIVIVTQSPEEGLARTRAHARADELALRLRGVVSVTLLDNEAVGVASKLLRAELGNAPQLEIAAGDIHAFLPGVSDDGYRSERHRIVAQNEIEGRGDTTAALLLAPSLLRRAVEMAPPVVWRERGRDLIEHAGSDEAAIRASRLIEQGESPQVEFKSTMRFDMTTQGVNKDLIKSVTKTLAAFLNCDGGTLLIGIADDGAIVGIERDLQTLRRKPNIDGWELHLREAIGEHLGNEVNPAINVAFSSSSGQTVALVSCARSPKPIFLEETQSVTFYVRAGNSTRPLNVREATDYIARHWSETRTPGE